MYLTRNQAYRKVPWVRIPPSPPGSKQKRALAARFSFLYTNRSTIERAIEVAHFYSLNC